MKFKNLIYIIFFVLIAFSISTSYIVFQKKQYIPRNQTLKTFNNISLKKFFSNKIEDSFVFQSLKLKYKLFGKVYELIVQGNRTDFMVFLRTNKDKTIAEINSYYLALSNTQKEPIKKSKTEHFNNFYKSLYFTNPHFQILALNCTINNLSILYNCFYHSISINPHAPPPKLIM